LRHPHQTTSREGIERTLAEPAEARHRQPAPRDDDLTAPLHSLQILAEAIVELTDPDFALRVM
jgi:hypothetical protein